LIIGEPLSMRQLPPAGYWRAWGTVINGTWQSIQRIDTACPLRAQELTLRLIIVVWVRTQN